MSEPSRPPSDPSAQSSSADDPLDAWELDSLADEVDLDPSGVTQELTAYLDGELSSEEQLRVEQRLHSDPEYLAQMQALQRTWEAFDAISVEDVGDSFMRTTMEIVVADAKSTALPAATRKTQYLRPALGVLVPLLIFSVSFGWARYAQTKPHRELYQNLDLIERLDQYQKAGLDFDFLVKLNQRELFADNDVFDSVALEDLSNVVGDIAQETTQASASSVSPPERLASMGLTETQQLKINYEAYSKLSQTQRAELEEFHQQLNRHPDQGQLLSVLNKYYRWLKSIGATDKARLLDSDAETRLKEISRLLSEQNRVALGRQGATKLPLDRDEEHLLNWFDLTIKSNEPLFRQEFPRIVSEFQQRSPTAPQVPKAQLLLFSRRAPLNQIVAILIRTNPGYVQDTIYQDIDLLRRGLSFEAQVIIAEQAPVENQKTLIWNWIVAAKQAESAIPEEKLQEFYEQLPAEQRDQLDQMSMEEWTSTLSRMYREKNETLDTDTIPLLFNDF